MGPAVGNRIAAAASGGAWKTTDGGSTWKRLEGHGLPKSPVGKSMSPSRRAIGAEFMR
jgi:photosystem II stability/assembly factor-like uncharacterized protein